MKKLFWGILILVFSIQGCATSRIAAMEIGKRTDIFHMAAPGEPVPSGYAELVVLASFKTRKPWGYLGGRTSLGASDYSLLLNIDGQLARISGDIAEETTAAGETNNPESGDGLRCLFEVRLFLKPGIHRLFVAIPKDRAALDREITLPPAKNVLQLTPVYGKMNVGRLVGLEAPSSFYEGMLGFRAFLNGREICNF